MTSELEHTSGGARRWRRTTRMLRVLSVGLAAAVVVPGSAVAAVFPIDGSRARPTPPTLPGNEEILQTIRDLTAAGPRRIGTPSNARAVEYVADKLRSYGLTGVTVEKSASYSWENLGHGLRVGDETIASFPSAYSLSAKGDVTGVRSTPAGGLDADIVDVGAGGAKAIEKADVRGKVVVFDLKFTLPLYALLLDTEYLYDPSLSLFRDLKAASQPNPYVTNYESAIRAAQEGGAAGFVGVLSDYFNSNKYYNEFYRRLTVTIPGLWVAPDEGRRMRALYEAGAPKTVNLSLSTQRAKVDAHSVYGYLEGRSKDTIMIQSHHDSVWDGAVEDGSGTAEVLALAKHFSHQAPGSRQKTLMFTTNDSHFSGYQAHMDFAERHIVNRDPRVEPHRIVADLTIEHIAKQAVVDADGSLRMTGDVEPRAMFSNLNPYLKGKLAGTIKRNDLRRTALLGANLLQPVGIPTDASFYMSAGVPTVSLIAGPMYLYDEADTIDKVAVDQLQPVAKAFAEFADDLDRVNSETIGATPLFVSTWLGRQLFPGIRAASE